MRYPIGYPSVPITPLDRADPQDYDGSVLVGVPRFSAEIVHARTAALAMSHTLTAGAHVIGTAANGIYLLSGKGIEIHGRGVQERDIDRYLPFAHHDPLLDHLVTEQTAVHDAMLFDLRAWRKLPLFDAAVGPAGLCHYLLAPILNGATVIGAVTFGRPAGHPFGVRDLVRATTLASYLAARLIIDDALPAIDTLRSRHRDVAVLVAKGFSNPEIARLLGVSVNYVKQIMKALFRSFDVSSRAELAAFVSRSG